MTIVCYRHTAASATVCLSIYPNQSSSFAWILEPYSDHHNTNTTEMTNGILHHNCIFNAALLATSPSDPVPRPPKCFHPPLKMNPASAPTRRGVPQSVHVVSLSSCSSWLNSSCSLPTTLYPHLGIVLHTMTALVGYSYRPNALEISSPPLYTGSNCCYITHLLPYLSIVRDMTSLLRVCTITMPWLLLCCPHLLLCLTTGRR